MTKTTEPLKAGTQIKVGRKVYTVKSSQRMGTGTVVYRTREGVAVPAGEIAAVVAK